MKKIILLVGLVSLLNVGYGETMKAMAILDDAVALKQKGSYEQAVRRLKEYLVVGNSKKYKSVARVNLGFTYLKLGEIDTAMDVAAVLTEGNFVNEASVKHFLSICYNHKGYEYLKKGEYKQAIPFLEKSVAVRGDFVFIVNNLAYCYLRLLERGQTEYRAKIVALFDTYKMHLDKEKLKTTKSYFEAVK